MLQISELKSSFNVFKLANFKILKFTFYAIASIAFLLVSFSAFSQAPAAIPYQAVARDVNGNLLAGQAISLRLSIRNLTSAGTVVYSETKSTTTNSFGLFNINIGEGTPLTGTLAGVNWSNGAKFIQVEMDATGGTSYVNMGTIQMMSVPYALYASKSANLPDGTANGNTMRWNGTAWVADNTLFNNGTNIGIGTSSPATKLDVAGTTKTTNLQMTTGAGANKILQSDAAGNASWVNSTSLPITELDPQVGTLSNNKVPKWNGSTLTDGVMYDNGTNVGIGTSLPIMPLTVRTSTADTFENVASLANSNGDAGFQLNTTRGDVTNTSGSVMTQIGQAYNGNPPTEAMRFHRGFTSTDGAISITTANTERMRIMNNGNIGIGTTAPRGIFDVQKHGDIYLSDSTNSGSDQYGYLPGNVVLAPYNGTNLSYLTARRENTTGSNELQLRTVNNGTTINAMRIDSAGNVGIGTTNPMNKLDIEGGVAIGAGYSGSNIAPTNGAIIQGNVGLGTGTQTPINKLDVEGGIAIGAGYSGTNVAPTNGAIIQGNVGIGTSDARAPLDLGTTVANRKIILNASQDNSHQFTGFGVNATASGNNLRYQIDSTEGNHTFYAATSPTTSAELMRISGTGNVGIGTTAPTQKLDVSGTTKTTNLQMTSGAAAGRVLQSDATGNASWVNANTLTVTEFDPEVASTVINKVPRWNGSSLVDGVISDNGTNVSIGVTSPTSKLHIKSASNLTTPLSIQRSNSTTPLFNVSEGNPLGSGIVEVYDYLGNEAIHLHSNSFSWITGILGIGTTTPRGIFDVQKHGDIYLSDSTNSGSDQTGYLPGNINLAPFNGTNISYLSAKRENGIGSNELQIRTVNNGVLKNAIRIDSEGNVGIGMTNPHAPLQFANTPGGNRKIVLFEGANNDHQFYGFGINTSTLRFQSASGFGFYTATSDTSSKDVMHIQGNGNVGINSSDPKTRLEIDGALSIVGNPNYGVLADNDTMNTQGIGYLQLTSNSVVATDRTIVLRNGQQVGQLLFIECQPIGAGQFEILDGAGSNTRTTGTITMTPGDMIQFIWNGSDWAQVSYSNNN